MIGNARAAAALVSCIDQCNYAHKSSKGLQAGCKEAVYPMYRCSHLAKDESGDIISAYLPECDIDHFARNAAITYCSLNALSRVHGSALVSTDGGRSQRIVVRHSTVGPLRRRTIPLVLPRRLRADYLPSLSEFS
eukprot:PhM_4_TR6328/c1_g1_i3/m.1958